MQAAGAALPGNPATALMSSMDQGRGAHAQSLADRLQSPGASLQGKDGLRKAAEDFEAVFVSQMLAPMFKGISTDGLFGGGHAEQVWRSMMVDEMGKSVAANGSIGLADSIEAHLLRLQEA